MKFFETDAIQGALAKCLTLAEEAKKKGQHGFGFIGITSTILREMKDAPAEFDERCSISIETIGDEFRKRMLFMGQDSATDQGTWKSIHICAYRFLVEFNLFYAGELPTILHLALQNGGLFIEDFTEAEKNEIRWAQTQLPMQVAKKLINDPRIADLRSANSVFNGIGTVTRQAQSDLDSREKRVQVLVKKLEDLRTGYNFVGLHDGFKNLFNRKKIEWGATLAAVVVFGILLVLPLSYELNQVRIVLAEKGEAGLKPLLYFVPPILALELIILYYFRLSMTRLRSVDVQLMQLQLRMTLCQFIQSYADYAETISKQSPNTLEKFENLIFSGLQTSEEKLPNTFDGIDQLGSLIDRFRSAPGKAS